MEEIELYEPETVSVFYKVLSEGDQVIVCGAHQGYFVSVCSVLVGDRGRVFGFEPEHYNFSLLTDKCKGLKNVELFNLALASRKAEATLYVNSDNNGGHALWDVSLNIHNIKTKQDHLKSAVNVETIDTLFADRDLSRLKLLMLDAEGSEHAIIKGALNTLNDYLVPYIICEINHYALHQCGTSQLGLANQLKVNGYTGYLIQENELKETQGERISVIEDGKEIVFNMLFSRRGKV